MPALEPEDFAIPCDRFRDIRDSDRDMVDSFQFHS